MKTFRQLFDEHNGDSILKWSNYPEIYDKHFTSYRDKPISILEIGVYKGGSMRLWEKYFPKAKIYGVDIDEKCKHYESDRTKIFIGDQSDRSFLRNVMSEIKQVDIIIDDGSHRADHQIATFEEMYYFLKTPGVYLIEDIELNYRQDKKPDNFMDFMKNKIDELNVRKSMPGKQALSHQWKDLEVRFTNTTNSITFYDNVIVLEKENMRMPREIRK